MYLFNGIENLPMTFMLSLMLANEWKHVECNKQYVRVCAHARARLYVWVGVCVYGCVHVCVCVCKVYLVIYTISHFITL